MSIEKKVILIASLLSANACSDEHNIENRVNIAGINFKHGVTDSEGRKSFTDDQVEGRTADLHVTNQFAKGVSEANILYADGSGFEMFFLVHPAYQPQLQIALHNSGHAYSLTPAPLQFLYHDKTENERSFTGAKNAFDWSKNWPSTGCYEKEELGSFLKPGAYLVKKSASYLTVGVSDVFIDDLAETLENEIEDGEIVVVHSFIPSKYGIYGLTSISSLEIKKGSCDSYQEEPEGQNNDYQCDDTIFCDLFNDSLDKWNLQGSAYINNGWLKMEGADIVNKGSIDFQQCNSSEVRYQALVKGNYGLYLGNEIALYADGKNGSMQIVCGSNGENIGIDLENNHQVKVQLGDHLSVNGNFIPCNKNPLYVNFSAGSVSTLELDYVEVRCK